MPLNIKVNADYRITSDPRNIIVNRKYLVDPTKSPNWTAMEAKGKSGAIREEWREVAFFPTVDIALKWIVSQQVRDSNAESLTELLHEIRGFHREISDVWGE